MTFLTVSTDDFIERNRKEDCSLQNICIVDHVLQVAKCRDWTRHAPQAARSGYDLRLDQSRSGISKIYVKTRETGTKRQNISQSLYSYICT